MSALKTSSPTGAAPQRAPEPAPAKKAEPPPQLEPPKVVEEDSRLQYNIPADKSPKVSASSEKYDSFQTDFRHISCDL